MERDMMEAALASYEDFLRKVVRRSGVFSNHPQYYDYLQELRIALYGLLQDFASVELFELRYPRPYLFKRLLWLSLDQQRKYRRHEWVQLEHEEEAPQEDDLQTLLELQDQWKNAYQKLTKKEQRKLQELLQDADLRHLSRQDRHRYRQGLKKNLKKFSKNGDIRFSFFVIGV